MEEDATESRETNVAVEDSTGINNSEDGSVDEGDAADDGRARDGGDEEDGMQATTEIEDPKKQRRKGKGDGDGEGEGEQVGEEENKKRKKKKKKTKSSSNHSSGDDSSSSSDTNDANPNRATDDGTSGSDIERKIDSWDAQQAANQNFVNRNNDLHQHQTAVYSSPSATSSSRLLPTVSSTTPLSLSSHYEDIDLSSPSSVAPSYSEISRPPPPMLSRAPSNSSGLWSSQVNLR